MLTYSIESYLGEMERSIGERGSTEDLCNTSGGLEVQSPPLPSHKGRKRDFNAVTSTTSPDSSAHDSFDLEDGTLPPEIEKPALSYVALISTAILSDPEKRLLLADIYKFITKKFPYYQYAHDKAWKNSIRHNLSLNECFVKNGRAPDGKGNFWSIHPACLEDFKKGDFRRRQARRRAKRSHQLPEVSEHNAASGATYAGHSVSPHCNGYNEMKQTPIGSHAMTGGSYSMMSNGYPSPIQSFQTNPYLLNSFMSPDKYGYSTPMTPLPPTIPPMGTMAPTFSYQSNAAISHPLTSSPDLGTSAPAAKRPRSDDRAVAPNVSVIQMAQYYGNMSYVQSNHFNPALNLPQNTSSSFCATPQIPAMYL